MTKSKNKKNSVSDQVRELTELLQRTQASFENYRKQQEKRIEDIQNQASKELIIQLLPILDNFELALKDKNNKNSNQESFAQGIGLIHSQLFTILKGQGLKSIKTNDSEFDPNLHEALMKVTSSKPENAVIEEFQKGFTLNSQVIRHAKVKISAGIPETSKVSEGLEAEVSKQKENKEDVKQNNKKINDGGK